MFAWNECVRGVRNSKVGKIVAAIAEPSSSFQNERRLVGFVCSYLSPESVGESKNGLVESQCSRLLALGFTTRPRNMGCQRGRRSDLDSLTPLVTCPPGILAEHLARSLWARQSG